MRRFRRLQTACLTALVLLALGMVQISAAWEWSDFVGGEFMSTNVVSTLSMAEVANLRVRDIKRRLTRNHGYTAEEVSVMLDKKDLIQALAFEEEKIRLQQEDEVKRALVNRGIITAIITVVVIMCWPLFQQAYDVASVNFVVYTDRKRHEARRCWDLKSIGGMVGCSIMFILDILQLWLTGSILLSWVMRSKYFFPTPRLPVQPAKMMGGEMAQSSMSNYGINVGPMVVGWIMRFTYARVETWTGQALASAHRRQRKAARENETPEEKAARKAAKKQAKRDARARQAAMEMPETTLPQGWMQPSDEATGDHATEQQSQPLYRQSDEKAEEVPIMNSDTHNEFLDQIDHHNSEFDDLD